MARPEIFGGPFLLTLCDVSADVSLSSKVTARAALVCFHKLTIHCDALAFSREELGPTLDTVLPHQMTS